MPIESLKIKRTGIVKYYVERKWHVDVSKCFDESGTMPFLIRKLSKQKGKKVNYLKKKQLKQNIEDEEVLSESDPDININNVSDDDEETAQEKRIRLAKQYLTEVEQETQQHEEISHLVSKQLRNDVLQQSGKLRKLIASTYIGYKENEIIILKSHIHRRPITCICLSSDDRFVFSASKDASIVKWSLQNNKKVHHVLSSKRGGFSHIHPILTLTISSDDKFLVSGCQKNEIKIWDVENLKLLNTFDGHKGQITGLSFSPNSHQLFSCSTDRLIKIWNLDEMAYVETLYGHKDGVLDIDCITKNNAVTTGGRDGTIRLWKITEDTHLVFLGQLGSIDHVKFIDEKHFVSGSDDGSVAIWNISRKKPNLVKQVVHGILPASKEPFWITAVGVNQNTDLIATGKKLSLSHNNEHKGSYNGYIYFWKCSNNFKEMDLLFSIPVIGCINSIKFTKDGNYVILAVSSELKLGRWWQFRDTFNKIWIIPFDINK